VGGFPQGWSEWNGQYRDRVRDYWRGIEGSLPDFAAALCGSSDIYGPSRRGPRASVNIITVHDGFTLHDLVSYNDKHNEANAEDNRDGESHNRSWNCGAEGPTDDPEILAFRERQKRNFLTTLFASRGVPLLLGGDEMGRTQGGNNNAYCQDNPTGWVDWSLLSDPHWAALCTLVSRLVALRRAHPVLRRGGFFSGLSLAPEGLRDVAWFAPGGKEMDEPDWFAPAVTLGMFLSGRDIAQRDARGEPVVDESFLLVVHAGHRPVEFTLPGAPWAQAYEGVLDTALEDGGMGGQGAVEAVAGGTAITVAARSARLLRVRAEG
jgi:glycogen operon protein